MARTLEKIMLAVILVLFLGIGSIFILGQQDSFSLIGNEQVTGEATADIGITEAKNIALQAVGGGIVTEMEEKTEYYEVEIENNGMETEVKVNKEDGDVLSIEQERIDDEDEQEITQEGLKLLNPQLSQDQAKAIALDLIGGGRVVSVESEREGGILLHEVEIYHDGNTIEIEIDAETGDIVEIERE